MDAAGKLSSVSLLPEHPMELEDLQTFVIVADSGGVSEAAGSTSAEH